VEKRSVSLPNSSNSDWKPQHFVTEGIEFLKWAIFLIYLHNDVMSWNLGNAHPASENLEFFAIKHWFIYDIERDIQIIPRT